GEAPPSEVACTLPAPPTNVTLTEVQPDVFQLTWTDNSAIEDGYQVLRIVDSWCPGGTGAGGVCNTGGSGARFLGSVVASLPPNSTSYAPVPNLPVVSSLTECDCIYVVATKFWGV